MRELAKDLMISSGTPVRMSLIHSLPFYLNRSHAPQLSPPSPISSLFSQNDRDPSPPASGKEIAYGLMLLEGDHFSRIHASDCLYHLRGQPEERIRAATDLNNRVMYWVKKSILRNESLKTRTELLESMIVAAEARKPNSSTAVRKLSIKFRYHS